MPSWLWSSAAPLLHSPITPRPRCAVALLPHRPAGKGLAEPSGVCFSPRQVGKLRQGAGKLRQGAGTNLPPPKPITARVQAMPGAVWLIRGQQQPRAQPQLSLPARAVPKEEYFPRRCLRALPSSGSAWPAVNNSPRPGRWMLPSRRSLNIHGEGREGKGKEGGEGWFGVGAASPQPLQPVTPRCGCGGSSPGTPLAARAFCGCRQPPGVVFGAGPVAGSHLGAEQHAAMLQLLFGEGGGGGRLGRVLFPLGTLRRGGWGHRRTLGHPSGPGHQGVQGWGADKQPQHLNSLVETPRRAPSSQLGLPQGEHGDATPCLHPPDPLLFYPPPCS